ncbi:MAG: hypothetical protein FJ087_22690, partial [Deltaproteobacteria bacterium]|nr:hypothetical protein [Deltaproteobacteria bacterium]
TAAYGGVTCAVASRRGYHYLARVAGDRSLRVTRLRHGALIEEPVTIAARAVPDGCLVADLTVSTTGAVWLLLVRIEDVVGPRNEWLVLNATAGVTVPVTRGTGAVHAAPTVDAHPFEDVLLVGVPTGDDLVTHGVFTVDPVRKLATRRVSPDRAYSPAWSPCGRFVAYCTSAIERVPGGGAAVRGPSTVWVADREFGDATPVAHDEWVFDLSWTGDGGHLVLLDGGVPRANKGHGGVLRVVDVAAGLGACDLLRPGDGAEGRSLFLHVDAGDLRLGRGSGGASGRRPPASLATLTPDALADAVLTPGRLEPTARHVATLARAEHGLPPAIREALVAWAAGPETITSELWSPAAVPAVARLLAAALGGPGPDLAPDSFRDVARKAFELLVWRHEATSGLRSGIPEKARPAALDDVALAAGALAGRASALASQAGVERTAAELREIAARLVPGGGAPDAGRAVPLKGLLSPGEPADRVSGHMTADAWARLQAPYVALADLTREVVQPDRLPEDPDDAWATAVLLDAALANATLKREGDSIRSAPMAFAARAWWDVGGLRRFAAALARITTGWEGPSLYDVDVATLADKCWTFLPDSELVALPCLEALLDREDPPPDVLFRAFRVAWRLNSVRGPVEPVDPDRVRRAAEIAVAAERVLARVAPGSRDAEAASDAIRTLEDRGVIRVAAAPFDPPPSPKEPSLHRLWRRLGSRLDVSVGDLGAFADSLMAGLASRAAGPVRPTAEMVAGILPGPAT